MDLDIKENTEIEVYNIMGQLIVIIESSSKFKDILLGREYKGYYFISYINTQGQKITTTLRKTNPF
ncbi:MAG: T9SS type A sorting domain-containing protein [Spirochaetes bacterium]|nr:T9SS type A sorting domain-containing protein [Spirochaetota bacterium]